MKTRSRTPIQEINDEARRVFGPPKRLRRRVDADEALRLICELAQTRIAVIGRGQKPGTAIVRFGRVTLTIIPPKQSSAARSSRRRN